MTLSEMLQSLIGLLRGRRAVRGVVIDFTPSFDPIAGMSESDHKAWVDGFVVEIESLRDDGLLDPTTTLH